MIKLDIPAITTNKCYKLQYKSKTNEGLLYEKIILAMLPEIDLPEKPFAVTYEFGLSAAFTYLKNYPVALTEILQKHYDFSDQCIVEFHISKKRVDVGSEYIRFKIESVL